MPMFSATVRRRRVVFRHGMITSLPQNTATTTTATTHPARSRTELEKIRRGKQVKNSDMDLVGNEVTSEGYTMIGKGQEQSHIPNLFTSLPPLRDLLTTETTVAQDESLKECLPFLTAGDDPYRSLFDFGSGGLPRLEREKHVKFLHTCLKNLSDSYVGLDASRPWQVYWVLTGLSLLGENVQQYRERSIMLLYRPWTELTKVGTQSSADRYPHAESRWWLRRWSRSRIALRPILCSDTEPRYGWWEGKLGID